MGWSAVFGGARAVLGYGAHCGGRNCARRCSGGGCGRNGICGGYCGSGSCGAVVCGSRERRVGSLGAMEGTRYSRGGGGGGGRACAPPGMCPPARGADRGQLSRDGSPDARVRCGISRHCFVLPRRRLTLTHLFTHSLVACLHRRPGPIPQIIIHGHAAMSLWHSADRPHGRLNV